MTSDVANTCNETLALGRRTFPAKALRVRLGLDMNSPPWSAYLPHRHGFASEATPAATVVAPVADDTSEGEGTLAFAHVPVTTTQSSLHGRVWAMARDAAGSREVQHALERLDDDEIRSQLAQELHGKVLEAMWCPHANHVIQKCIETLRPSGFQFVIDELLQRAGAVARAARHKYGCRIVQRLAEHSLPWQIVDMMEILLADVAMLSRHPYGNYVVQSLLQHGTEDQRVRLVTELGKGANEIGRDTFGCAVISAAMCQLGHAGQIKLARVLTSQQGLLCYMAQARHGNLAVRMVLQVLEGYEHECARRMLLSDSSFLRTSRYGRAVMSCLLTAPGKTSPFPVPTPEAGGA